MNDLKKLTIRLYNISEHIIFWSRHQNYSRTTTYLKDWISTFANFARLLFLSDFINIIEQNTVTDNLNSIMNAQNNNDYLLLADLIENNTLNILSRVLSQFEITSSKYTSNDKTYTLMESSWGTKTIQVKASDKCFYLHSIISPIREALTLTDNYFNPDAEGYIVFGCGLGYFPVELYLRCDKSVPIMIYECDRTIYDISKIEGYYKPYLNEYFTITHDPDLLLFINAVENTPEYDIIIHAPSINNIPNPAIRSRLKELFIHDSSIRDQKCGMVSNFRSNIHNCNHYVDELSESFIGKDVYLIAAGPSLDKNIELLKSKPNNSIILAVGSVYKKLLSMSIVPDYVIFLDASELIYSQFDGLQNSSIPLLVASTAYRNIALESKADTYLICQKGFSYAESYASSQNHITYETGGSVSSIAFDVAIRLGAKKIVTLGLDLSYTNEGKLHADDAGQQDVSTSNQDSELLYIDGFWGQSVMTLPSFELYRQWFINYISNLKNTKENLPQLINATEGGCFIPGMEHKKLSLVLNNI